MSRWVGAVGLWLVALMGSVPAGTAAFQNGSSDVAGGARAGAVTSALRVLNATRVEDDLMEIDGRAGEDAWSSLFVFLKAHESRPEEIVGQLTRRDQGSHSDILGVVIDSYFERLTAFQFAVNPVGVKHDVYHFDDTSEDAVWDVETSIDSDGWSAEFRIPYSQSLALRFRDGERQTWGINFIRRIARHSMPHRACGPEFPDALGFLPVPT